LKGGLLLENRIAGLLEQMEELVDRGARVPLLSKVMVDESTVQNILDDLRRSVPEEVKNARIIMEDRDRILTEARSTAKAILEQAQKQAELLLQEDTVARKGQEKAETMVHQAQHYYLEVKQAALVYSNEMLKDLEEKLSMMLRQIQNNRGELAAQAQDQSAGQ
jgi:vacuolar-type H+-ATPase subunit H